MAFTIEIEFFNSYMLKKVAPVPRSSAGSSSGLNVGVFPGLGLPGGVSELSNEALYYRNWYVEESRIRGGFNNTSTDQGVRAYLDDEYPLQQNRINSLIYSGVFNSRTGVNQTNVFSVAGDIVKSLDISYGSIQKSYAEDTNLIVFQENKIHRALIDKDTIYTTEGGTQTQAGAAVIGQFVPYKGEYGISKNPESFAIYNYRKYFSDRNRNAIMRLSNDGLTEISMYGMRDYFRDELANITDVKSKVTIPGIGSLNVSAGGTTSTTYVDVIKTSLGDKTITPGMQVIVNGITQPGYITVVFQSPVNPLSWRIFYSQLWTTNFSTNTILATYNYKGKVQGGWDIHNKNYVISLQKYPSQFSTEEDSYETLAFDEDINGWVSFFTYKPVIMFSMLNKYYSIGKQPGNNNSTELYEHYYNTTPDPLTRGVFYNVRKPSNVTFVFNPQPDVMKNFNTISYEGSNGWEVVSYRSGFTGQDPNPDGSASYVQNNDTTSSIKSYNEGSYTDVNTGYTFRAGFDRKENRYVANLRNNSTASNGEVIFGAQMSGIKGYFTTVKIQTDDTTQLGGPKELWASGTNFVASSY